MIGIRESIGLTVQKGVYAFWFTCRQKNEIVWCMDVLLHKVIIRFYTMTVPIFKLQLLCVTGIFYGTNYKTFIC